jgi:hypothetical protein
VPDRVEAALVERGIGPGLHLERAEAAVDVQLRLRRVGLGVVQVNEAVELHRGAAEAAEKLVHREAGHLALQVVQRGVDRGDRVCRVRAPLDQVLDPMQQVLDPARVLADEERPELRQEERAGSLLEDADDLAVPGEPLVGLDGDQHDRGVRADAVGRREILREGQLEDLGLDVDDTHSDYWNVISVTLPPRSTRGRRESHAAARPHLRRGATR